MAPTLVRIQKSWKYDEVDDGSCKTYIGGSYTLIVKALKCFEIKYIKGSDSPFPTAEVTILPDSERDCIF